MPHRPWFILIASSVLQFACGDASPGSDSASMPPATSIAGTHLGEPFTIVNGVITRESNEYGLQASLAVVHDADETDVTVTDDTGQICFAGELTRAVEGDFDSYGGFTAGFVVAPRESLVLTENLLSVPPGAPAWEFASASVLGLAFTVSGSVLPNNPSFGLAATPGGQDSGGMNGVGQELTIYGDCNAPPVTTSGQVIESLFGELENWWCIPANRSRWTASSAANFWWGIGSVIVNGADPNVAAVRDPYDFCLSDIRPIVRD